MCKMGVKILEPQPSTISWSILGKMWPGEFVTEHVNLDGLPGCHHNRHAHLGLFWVSKLLALIQTLDPLFFFRVRLIKIVKLTIIYITYILYLYLYIYIYPEQKHIVHQLSISSKAWNPRGLFCVFFLVFGGAVVEFLRASLRLVNVNHRCWTRYIMIYLVGYEDYRFKKKFNRIFHQEK